MSIPEPRPLGTLLDLHGRVAVVTGGSRGIGAAIVRRLAEAGATVVATARGQEALAQFERSMQSAGSDVVGISANAANVDDTQRIIDTTMQRFGRLDILVNNAAVFYRSLAEEMTEQVWDQTMDTDLKGAFFTARAAAEAMAAGGRGGRIINLLSLEAFRPTGFLPAYSAAKAGLHAVTKSLAVEYAAHQILVNAVVPGATMTQERLEAFAGKDVGDFQLAPGALKTRDKMAKMFAAAGGGPAAMMSRMPLGRPGYPDDLATPVLFLASDMASYISGACLTVDGAQGLR
jgi:NAD(P)-dependent dehydrogenase (short-subunit alcohol dehydrogenase family)